jgi:hypothetical protein
MQLTKRIAICFCPVLWGDLVARADDWDKKTIFTFNAPAEIPAGDPRVVLSGRRPRLRVRSCENASAATRRRESRTRSVNAQLQDLPNGELDELQDFTASPGARADSRNSDHTGEKGSRSGPGQSDETQFQQQSAAMN